MSKSAGQVVLAVVGIAAVAGVGVWAYLNQDNGQPPMLLLAGAGAIFAYLGLSGRQLSSFKAGGVEASLEVVVAEALDDPNIPERSKILISENVRRKASSDALQAKAAEVLRRRTEAMDYEERVGRALAGHGWVVVPLPGGAHADFRVQDFATGRDMYVEATWTDQPADAGRQEKWATEAARGRGELNSDYLIVASRLAEGTREPGIYQWNGVGEPTDLLGGLKATFALPAAAVPAGSSSGPAPSATPPIGPVVGVAAPAAPAAMPPGEGAEVDGRARPRKASGRRWPKRSAG